jgi:hypothetical protein
MEKCPKCGRIINSTICSVCNKKKDKYLDEYEQDKGGDAYDSGGDYGDGGFFDE